MLTRLKTTWRLLFAKKYIVLTIDERTGDGRCDYFCKPTDLKAFSAYLLSESRELVANKNMDNLVKQANEVLGNKMQEQ